MQPAAAVLQRCIDDISGLRPFEFWPDAVAGDAGRVQQILDVVIEPLGFLAGDIGKT